MWTTTYKCPQCGSVLDWSYATPGSRVAENVLLKCKRCGCDVRDPRLKLWSELGPADVFVTIYVQPILSWSLTGFVLWVMSWFVTSPGGFRTLVAILLILFVLGVAYLDTKALKKRYDAYRSKTSDETKAPRIEP